MPQKPTAPPPGRHPLTDTTDPVVKAIEAETRLRQQMLEMDVHPTRPTSMPLDGIWVPGELWPGEDSLDTNPLGGFGLV